MQNAVTIVKNAIRNTSSSYWEKICRTRAGQDPECEGSRFPRLNHQQVDKLVRRLVWEPYTHSAVKEPAQAFIARSTPNLELGVTRLGDVPEDAKLVFSDPKDTGKVELIWVNPPDGARPKVDFVVMLVGPNEEDNDMCVWTFFPGDPIVPSIIPRREDHYTKALCAQPGPDDYAPQDRNGRVVTKAEAANYRIEWVKIGKTQVEKNLEGSKKALSELED